MKIKLNVLQDNHICLEIHEETQAASHLVTPQMQLRIVPNAEEMRPSHDNRASFGQGSEESDLPDTSKRFINVAYGSLMNASKIYF